VEAKWSGAKKWIGKCTKKIRGIKGQPFLYVT
jgi:hypothetical protein